MMWGAVVGWVLREVAEVVAGFGEEEEWVVERRDDDVLGL